MLSAEIYRVVFLLSFFFENSSKFLELPYGLDKITHLTYNPELQSLRWQSNSKIWFYIITMVLVCAKQGILKLVIIEKVITQSMIQYYYIINRFLQPCKCQIFLFGIMSGWAIALSPSNANIWHNQILCHEDYNIKNTLNYYFSVEVSVLLVLTFYMYASYTVQKV